jgi:hypothetical protein
MKNKEFNDKVIEKDKNVKLILDNWHWFEECIVLVCLMKMNGESEIETMKINGTNINI